jgi:hypothetical protein
MGVSFDYGCLDMMREDEEGLAWMRRELEAVNRALVANQLPAHREPERLGPHAYRATIGSYGFSWIHFLRRIQANVLQNPQWKPTPCTEADEPWSDKAIDRELTVFLRSHLICHGDSAGYYVPIDFADVVYSDPPGAFEGDMLGSSHRLLAELKHLAPVLGVPLAAGTLDDQAAERLDQTDESDPFWREKLVWLGLFEAARLSVELGTMIRFH